MTTTYQVESWSSYYNDPNRSRLWLEHYGELEQSHSGRMPMGPDLPSYIALDAAGALLILTARAEGRLVGYCLVLVRPHMHYPTLCGFEDSYFVSRLARKGLVGYKLIKKTLEALRDRGCKKVFFMTKEFQSVAILLERLGMKKTDSVYSMWLES